MIKLLDHSTRLQQSRVVADDDPTAAKVRLQP